MQFWGKIIACIIKTQSLNKIFNIILLPESLDKFCAIVFRGNGFWNKEKKTII